ncbi:MAG: hypothetical protein CME62_08325 [Halobacteriovoraceae bacterium]|nr:hypothetical protein [Halobacteriovoraceae bacterium]|tara:strand:+ start:1122 stop:1727 length:606 start_codon:yes stop_codon:yes gene_type:complete
MFYQLDLYSTFFLGIYSLVAFIFSLKKYPISLNRFNAAVYAQWLALFVFLAIEFYSLYRGTYLLVVERYYPVILAFLHALLVFQISFVSVKELSTKKMNVLWRLPVIGALCGLFASEHQLWIHLSFTALIGYIYYLNRKYLVMLSGVLFFSFTFTLAFYWMSEFGLWYINILIFTLLLGINKYWNYAYCKFLSYGELKHAK